MRLDDLEPRSAQKRAASYVRLTGAPRVLRGTALGQVQPVLFAKAAIFCGDTSVSDLGTSICDLLALDSDLHQGSKVAGAQGIALTVVRAAVAIQRRGLQPVFDQGEILNPAPPQRPEFMLAVPYYDARAAKYALKWAVAVTARLLKRDRASDLHELTQRTLSLLEERAIKDRNSFHFLRVAYDEKLPLTRLPGNIHSIGQGIRSRIFQSTMTDKTSSLGTALARNKVWAAALLRRAGIPVPDHAIVRNRKEAAAFAAHIGYPVVIKPADRDGGVGVAAGLEDEFQVFRALDQSMRHSKRVLVEKHVHGRDFRLVVINGQVVWVIERVPAGIVGDGVRTVGALVAEGNRDPRRGAGAGAMLKELVLDEEATELLAGQGLNEHSIPSASLFVRLRRTANITSGGTPVLVPLSDIHPTNLRLAERAAAVLRLDIAGVDFICPNISQPWNEVGGAINEVNAQPQLGIITKPEIFGDILHGLLRGGDGRIPTVAVIASTSCAASATARDVHEIFVRAGQKAGLASRHGAWIGTEQVAWSDMSGVRGADLLFLEPTVEAAIIEISSERLSSEGAPFDRCDVVARVGGPAALNVFEADLIRRATKAIVLDADTAPEIAATVGDVACYRVALRSSSETLAALQTVSKVGIWETGRTNMPDNEEQAKREQRTCARLFANVIARLYGLHPLSASTDAA